MKWLINTYVIAGIIIFVFVFGMGLWLDFSWRDSLLAALALTIVGLALEWLRSTFGLEF
jgi:hypothetical protein